MPILLVLALTAACLPVNWPEPLFGGGREAAAASTAAAVALSLAVALALRAWVVKTLRREPGRKVEVARVYGWLRRVMFFVNVTLAAACVLAFGWGWLTQQVFAIDWNGKPTLAPFAELIVPLPYFIILFSAWAIYYDAERALHRTTVLGPIERPFWSRAGHFFHHLRQLALLVMLPVLLCVAYQTAARLVPEPTWSWCKVALVLMLPLVVLLMPLLIKPALGLKTMPAGPTRDRLESLARRLHFRYTDFLLWPTHGATANAMIVGLLPQVRYVIFTDRLLDELPADELDAVLGHEVGHAKHGHIPLYGVFLALSMTVLAALLILVDQEYVTPWMEQSERVKQWVESASAWVTLPPFVVTGIYVFLVFGFLSRRCERQADVYGCRAVSCGNPNCTGHDRSTVYPEGARGLCQTGIRTFVRALERVDLANGAPEPGDGYRRPTFGTLVKGLFKWLRSWQHSTMSRRVTFLLSLIGNPRRERRFQWRVTVLRWGLLAALAAALVVLGDQIGWPKLMQAL